MSGKEDEKVDRHDALISAPLKIFLSKPYNATFIEKRIEEIWATPKDEYADVFTFTRPENNVGLLKTSDARISCDLSIRNPQDALVGNCGLAVVPLHLRCAFKTKETKINEVLVTPSSNESHIKSYISFLTRQVPSGYADSKPVNMAYLDLAGQMATVGAAGSGAINRRALCRAGTHVIDMVDCTAFNDGDDVWMASVFKTEVKFVKAANQVIMMGVAHADLHVADARVSMKDMKITFPVFKLQDQLSSALNKMFVSENRDAKYYTSVFRTVNTIVPAGRRRIQENDVFNGSLPVRLFLMFSTRDSFNGTFDSNCFDFLWHNFSNISVTVNSQAIGQPITNQQQAYEQIRKVLNRKYSEMPFTYNAFRNGNAIIAFDLSTNEDTHFAVLPSRSSGVVNYSIDFSQNTAEGTIICAGEFRNEIKVGIKKPDI